MDNLLHNLREIRRLAPGKKICAAVKADAYGHGAVPVARFLEDQGVDCLAVATVDEGRELREAGLRVDILVLGLVQDEEIPDLVALGLSAVAADQDYLQKLQNEAGRQKRFLKIHLKVDTGMGRLGCKPEELIPLAKKLVLSLNLHWEGLCSHFPSSDSGLDHPTGGQIEVFKQLAADLKAQGLAPRILHFANSGGILDWPESHFDMVRPGILLYGYLPDLQVRNPGNFKPVMELVTRVMFKKRVSTGTRLSYGGTYETTSDTTVVTIPVGYADGYFRAFSNKAPVRIGNKIHRVSGRVCMDQIMVDVGDDNVQVGDSVVLFGPEGPTAWDLAQTAGTIPYEITCAVSRRVPRIYEP